VCSRGYTGSQLEVLVGEDIIGGRYKMKKLFFSILVTLWTVFLCGQVFAVGNIIDRGATSAETTAQARDDVWLSPKVIPDLGTLIPKFDHNTETLSGDKVLTTSDKPVQLLDCGGASRRYCILPAEEDSTDKFFYIYNASNGSGEKLSIRNDSPSTIVTLGPGMGMTFSCDGTSWEIYGKNGIYYDAISDKVGIGTTNPTRPLTVHANASEIFLMTGVENHGLMLQDLPDFASFLGYNGSSYNKIEFRARSGAGSQLNLSTNGSVGIGTVNPTSRAILDVDGVIGLIETSAPTALAGHGFVYSADVAGTTEVFAMDGAGNAPQLTPHNFALFEPDPLEKYPWSYYAENKALGVRINVDMAGAIRAIEELTGKTFIYYEDIPVTVNLENLYREKWINNYIKENTHKEEISAEQAFETIETQVDDTSNILTYEQDGYELNGTIVTPKFKPVYAKKTIKVTRLKDNIEFDKKTGKFYKTIEPTRGQAELAATTDFTFNPPKWISDRL